MMGIQTKGTDPIRPHILFVALTRTVNGVEETVEIPVRKAHFDKLTPSKQEVYTLQCAEEHACRESGWQLKRAARRAVWDADDKARSDAAASAAKAAELAKFIVTPQGFVTDKEGAIVGVQVTVTHQGHTASVVIPNDPANAEANTRIEWQKSKDAADAVQASLNAFAVSV